ncbi:MAG TPA: PepSY domain-containing protein [Phycisphaerales bacterium]|nr:PepSY domain-containing protein [Phycisphaerales bacterium]
MKRSVFGAFALALVTLAGLPATPATAAEVVPGMTLPDTASLAGFAAAESAAKNAAAFTTTRINLEPDEGVWRYRVEGFGIRGERVRVDVDAFTGAVRRARRDGGGGNRLDRDEIAIRSAQGSFTVTFDQAASIAAAANAGFFIHDVRLDVKNSGIVYKVQMVNATASREVRLSPVTGAILSTQAGDDNGGGSNSGGNSGNNNGGNNNGNNGGNTGTNPGNGNNGATFPGNLPNQSRAVVAALNTALTGKPAGTVVAESRYVRIRNITQFEVVTVAQGGIGTKTRIDLRTGAVVGTQGEQVGADDLARLDAFNAALGASTPISFQTAVTAAWTQTRGDVLKVEPELHNGAPVYEVRMQTGSRERTIKVHAVTGAIVS